MKQLIYIFILIIIVSCKNKAMKSMDMNAVEAEASQYKEKSIEEDFEIPQNNSFTHQNISTEKLQELYDLLALKQKHPEFNDKIQSQLKNYTNDTFQTSGEVFIKNLTLKSEVIVLSDSVEKIKLAYDIVSNEEIKEDSIWAEITTHTLLIDDKETKSKKIKFKKN